MIALNFFTFGDQMQDWACIWSHSTSGDYFQYQDDTFYLVGGNLIAKNPIQTDYNWWLPNVCK